MPSLRLELITPVRDDRPVFMAGDFTGWSPNHPDFQLQATAPGHYTLTLPDSFNLAQPLAYKYTRGGWDQVELDAAGDTRPNRTLMAGADFQADTVPHWRWFGSAFNPDFLPKLVGDELALPQLADTRRITVLLPYDYDRQPEKRYPVLYLNDGQNLFGEGVGYGSWHIDQKLAVLAARQQHEVIVVTIDHGEEKRIQEFTVEQTRAGRGQGRQYIKSIKETLKPFIDSNLRTMTGPEHTGVGGSSLGGLISIYAGLLYPGVFGRLMVFSPSLWISPKIYFDAIKFQSPASMKVYLYGGEAESKYMVPNMQRFNDALQRQQYGGQSIDLTISVNPDGTHEETHWSREFPKAIDWLFY
jgi:predicted alpha/beta superfamily hydrolase